MNQLLGNIHKINKVKNEADAMRKKEELFN